MVPLLEDSREAAFLSATQYLDHDVLDERGWAHGSLAELWLLKLGAPGLPEEHHHYRSEMDERIEALVRLFPTREHFVVTSTRRQLERYHEWWGTPEFFEHLRLPPRPHWHVEGGLVDTAREMSQRLSRLGRGG